MMTKMEDALSGAKLIGEGFGSKVYLTHNGQIIRVAKNQITREKHRREVVILRVLTGYVQSVVIPDPTIIIEPSQDYPYGARGYDQIAGKPLQPEDITSNRVSAIAAQIAQFISEVQQVPLEELGKDIEMPPYLPPDEEFTHMWERVATFISAQAPAILPAIATAFSKSTTAARQAQTPRVLLHADLWYENMIFDGGKVVGVIDFEAVSVGHPIVDFMTQGYLGDTFRRAVIGAFQRYGDFQYDDDLGKSLMFLRELRGLDYGIQTQDMDTDSLTKLATAAAEL